MNDDILINRLKNKQCIICGKEVKLEDDVALVEHKKYGLVMVHKTHKIEGEKLE